MSIIRYGKITEITSEYGADKNDVVVYVEMSDNSITGLHISKCRGFTPKVGDEVRIILGDTEDIIEKENSLDKKEKHRGKATKN